MPASTVTKDRPLFVDKNWYLSGELLMPPLRSPPTALLKRRHMSPTENDDRWIRASIIFSYFSSLPRQRSLSRQEELRERARKLLADAKRESHWTSRQSTRNLTEARNLFFLFLFSFAFLSLHRYDLPDYPLPDLVYRITFCNFWHSCNFGACTM